MERLWPYPEMQMRLLLSWEQPPMAGLLDRGRLSRDAMSLLFATYTRPALSPTQTKHSFLTRQQDTMRASFRVFGWGSDGLGWIQPSFLGWVEPISLFGCTSNFGDGVNSSHIWLKKLGIGVGWQFNSVATGIGLHFSSGTLDLLEFNQGWIRKSFSLALLHQEPCKRNQIGFLPFLLLS